MKGRPPFWHRNHWRWRWQQLCRGRDYRLHRIAKYETKEEHQWVGVRNGKALCGRKGDFTMPGIMSRMSGHRCRTCARLAGVDPKAKGAPFNNDEREPGCQGRAKKKERDNLNVRKNPCPPRSSST